MKIYKYNEVSKHEERVFLNLLTEEEKIIKKKTMLYCTLHFFVPVVLHTASEGLSN